MIQTIEDIKDPALKALAIQRVEDVGRVYDVRKNINIKSWFVFNQTPEGDEFWQKVTTGVITTIPTSFKPSKPITNKTITKQSIIDMITIGIWQGIAVNTEMKPDEVKKAAEAAYDIYMSAK